MNLSMEERGAQPQEPTAGRGGGAAAAGAGRFLTGDLSFFGVRNFCMLMQWTFNADVRRCCRFFGVKCLPEAAVHNMPSSLLLACASAANRPALLAPVLCPMLQVGSKNAGFFMGSSIKVATKRADELYVHELCLAAADLEARYQAREVRTRVVE